QLNKLDSAISEQKLIEFIQKLNNDKAVSGIILQMPLPGHIDYRKISQSIAESKDIEGISPVNLGKIIFGQARFIPCTAAAVMELVKHTGIDLMGKSVVIVGHSEIVGKPLSLLFLDKLATVTVCHIGTSRVGKLSDYVALADILVVAVGKPGLIKGEWIKKDAVVIDVGINRVDNKVVGDVEFETAQKRASWITPVPGGVGPLTVTMLMRNLILAAKLQVGE
ncbi:bifunctional 5,10-methylenetetrahydrofolate dehydrogenase/5,10-methenyltetrahydrofolate cyclohydrolase, partial [bacterium]